MYPFAPTNKVKFSTYRYTINKLSRPIMADFTATLKQTSIMLRAIISAMPLPITTPFSTPMTQKTLLPYSNTQVDGQYNPNLEQKIKLLEMNSNKGMQSLPLHQLASIAYKEWIGLISHEDLDRLEDGVANGTRYRQPAGSHSINSWQIRCMPTLKIDSATLLITITPTTFRHPIYKEAGLAQDVDPVNEDGENLVQDYYEGEGMHLPNDQCKWNEEENTNYNVLDITKKPTKMVPKL